MATMMHKAERFQPDVYGAGGIRAAVEELLGNELHPVQRFVLAEHTSVGTGTKNPGLIHEVIEIGMGSVDGIPTVRYCGSNSDPDGAGSHSVIGSGTDDSLSVAALCATLGYVLGRKAARHSDTCVVFREVVA